MGLIFFAFLISSTAGLIFRNSAKADVSFILYNRNFKDGTNVCFDLDEDNESRKFMEGYPCEVFTHGWFQSIQSPPIRATIKAYTENQDVNLLAFDWPEYSMRDYLSAVKISVPTVARRLSECVIKLHRMNLCPANRTHLVGHSLGAHVVGQVARWFNQEVGTPIEKVTGLEPAGPLYESTERASRLQVTDAKCVIATHTNRGRLGIKEDVGDGQRGVDFNPNGGGPTQPGCIPNDFCYHVASVWYYAESLRNTSAFLATRCDSYANFKAGRCRGNPTQYMGYPADCRNPGDYYVETGPVSSYMDY